MSEEQRRQLQQQLWNIANTLRGKMGADEFRDYILGFIFYKYLSEKIQRFADGELAQEDLKFADIKENTKEGSAYIAALEHAALSQLGYFLKPSELFHTIAMKGSNQKDGNGEGESHNFILADLTKILKNIEQSTQGTDSADDFVNLFEDLDLTSSKLGKTEKEKNDLVAKVLVHLDKIDFNLSDKTADVLGDAYEYLIGEFASGAGKKAGEFYTPQPVSTLLAKLVTCNNKNLKNVYDPTCGSGSLLLRVKREAAHVGKIYGQELNRTTYNLARMNMILHDVHYADFDIRQEDTLERPQHRDLRFDAIVANPPFSAHWGASQLHMSDDRFSVYGRLAPKTKADFAFVQHMIYHLAEEGMMAVVLPHGVLFRGAAEGHIRQYLIEQLNCLDAVIGLPANMFYGTPIPTCVLVFKRCRKHPDNILFIDASQHFEKVKTTNVMRPEHIAKIVVGYKARSFEAKYSHVASLASIKANGYNLNIPRYVDTFEAEETIDLEIVTQNLKFFDEQSKAADDIIAKFCEELNIPAPEGNNIFWLAQYKKGVMQQIFSQALRFKDEDGRDFPEWQQDNLLNLSESGFSNGVFNDPSKVGSGYKLINVLDMYINSTIDEKRLSLVELSESEFKRNKVEHGDIFFTRSSLVKEGIAFSNIYLGHSNDITFDGHLIKMHPKKNLLGSIFANYLLKTPSVRKQLVARGKTATMTTIGQADIAAVSVSFPSLAEQTKIAICLTAIDDKISHAQAQLAAAK
jgi:type I restriction enzyme M protein